MVVRKHHPDTLGAGNRIFVCRVRPTGEAPWPPELPASSGVSLLQPEQGGGPDRTLHLARLDARSRRLQRSGGRSRRDMMQRLRARSGLLSSNFVSARRRRPFGRRRWPGDLSACPRDACGGLATRRRRPCGQRLRGLADRAGPDRARAHRDARDRRAPCRNHERLRRPAAARHRGWPRPGCRSRRGGRQDRHSARARTDRLLPCGVLDTGGACIATPRRKTMARALGIDWIDTAHEVWPDQGQSWLIEASAVMARA